VEKGQWKIEFKKQIEQITDPHQLELVGVALTPEQFICVLDFLNDKHTAYNEKLIPILAGLSHEVFFQALPNLQPAAITVLQHESITIPIQLHLTALTLEKFKMLDQLAALVLTLEALIEAINLENIGFTDIQEIEEKIDFLSLAVDTELNSLNKALSLAWNSDRIDLIEKLSLLKETIQKYSTFSIGNKKQQGEGSAIHAAGLYARLDNKLNCIYEGIHENIPAIEALAKLSIWYIQDYYEVGLLPEIESEKFLGLDSATHSEKERVEYREDLIGKVKNRLKAYGLLTIEDLKNAKIYSKKALKEYTTDKN